MLRGGYTTLQAGRGLAALLVVLFHASETIFDEPGYWNQVVFGGFFRFGSAGVAFFFVLSGFIILNAHRRDLGRPEVLASYFYKRAIRIFPPYWMVAIPMAALYLLVPSLGDERIRSWPVIANSFVLIGPTNAAVLAVAWTLFHEVLFYIMFGVAILSRRVGIVVISVWLLICAVVAFIIDSPHYSLGEINLLFGMGLLASIVVEKWRSKRPVVIAISGVVAFLICGVDRSYGHVLSSSWGDIAFGLSSMLFVIGAVEAERQGRLKAPRFLVTLGDASYSIYLVHYPALSAVAKIFLSVGLLRAIPADLAFVIVVALCTLAGVVFWGLVERPVVNGLRRAYQT